MYYFIDESGHGPDYIFVCVGVADPAIPGRVIKKWRDWVRHRKGKATTEPEYHDTKATDADKKRILTTIGEYSPDQVKFWAVLKPGYDGKHKQYYSQAIVELLKVCQITEEDTVIAIDSVERGQKQMDKHIRNIKRGLGMENLKISSSDSQKEKGIQIADAIAGAVSREVLHRNKASYADIIWHLIADDVKRI